MTGTTTRKRCDCRDHRLPMKENDFQSTLPEHKRRPVTLCLEEEGDKLLSLIYFFDSEEVMVKPFTARSSRGRAAFFARQNGPRISSIIIPIKKGLVLTMTVNSMVWWYGGTIPYHTIPGYRLLAPGVREV